MLTNDNNGDVDGHKPIDEEVTIEELKAQVALEEVNSRLAAKRLALMRAEADISNLSIKSVSTSSVVRSPAKKIYKAADPNDDPPGGDHDPNETIGYESSNSRDPTQDVDSHNHNLFDDVEVESTESPTLPTFDH